MKHAFILLWPHGFKYKEQIFTKIAEKYKIIYHNSFKINNLENFVMNLYVNENPEHINKKAKIEINIKEEVKFEFDETFIE